MQRVGIVAGEASGDLLGAHFVRALKRRLPDLVFEGIAGPRMQAEGAVSWFPLEKLAVRGYVEVLRHYREIRSIQRALIERLLRDPPRLVVGVDAPDFNFTVEAALKRAGVGTVHFVSPSLWAWRGERIETIRRAVTHMLTLFPFEPPLYRRAGVAVSYVGHPMADALPLAVDRQSAREHLGMPSETPLIALLPGSRTSELRYHADLFVSAAARVRGALPQARFGVPLVNAATRELFEQAIARQGAQGLDILLLENASEILSAADVALIASGTATLEAALLKCPMVICYKMASLTAHIMKRKAYLPYVGLPNILAQDFIVPEVLQEAATPERLAQELLALYHDAPGRERMCERFAAIHYALKQDCEARIAEAVVPYLDDAAPPHAAAGMLGA